MAHLVRDWLNLSCISVIDFILLDFKNSNSDIEESDELSIYINENMNWVCLSRIPFTTPTVYLDNSIIPSIYTVKDIPKLIRILDSKY